MGEQRAAPRPPRVQLPRRGAQPVAARCGARPAGGWSPRGEPGDLPGSTVLLIPAHSLCVVPCVPECAGLPGSLFVCVLASSGNFCLASGIPGEHFSLCSARICEVSFSRVRSGCASRAGSVPPFPPWMVCVWGGHSGAPVSRGPWKRTSRAGTWFCLCRFPRGWRESGCKLTFDSRHIPRSPACFSG